MDFGAIASATRRKAGGATACPLSHQSALRIVGIVASIQIPAAKPRKVKPRRETAFVVLAMVVRADGAILLERRPEFWNMGWPLVFPGGR